MIFPEQAEYATFANEMLKNQARKPDHKVAEVILTRIFNFCPKKLLDIFVFQIRAKNVPYMKY